MREHYGQALLLAALAVFPTLAEAQRRPATAQPRTGARHEFGLDAGLAWYSPDGGDQGIELGTPLDVRVGFVSRQKVMWEARAGLAFDSKGGSDASGNPASFYVFTPGVNAVYAMTPRGNRSGMYLTGGAGLNLVDGGALGGAGFGLNAAIGWRKPLGASALRYEVGLQWDSKIEDSGAVISPSTIRIGGRFGLSFWR